MTLSHTIIFETKRLIVRRFTDHDKDNFFLLSGNASVMQYIRPVNTKEESDKFLLENIDAYAKNPCGGRWAVLEKLNQKFGGSFAIIPMPSHPDRTQLGYSLLPENWGRGFATELTRAGLDYFMKNYIADEIYGVTEIPNTASQKVLLKAGFRQVDSFMENDKELLLFVVKRDG
ncbi:MAG: GNAT family N-acetyltransferase [Chitinophagaceae bacterium]